MVEGTASSKAVPDVVAGVSLTSTGTGCTIVGTTGMTGEEVAGEEAEEVAGEEAGTPYN